MNSTFKMVSVFVALAATPAWAAPPDAHAAHHPAGASDTAAPVAGAMRGEMPGGAMKHGRMMDMDAMSCGGLGAKRLTALKGSLALAPAQLPLWDAFADASGAMRMGMGMHPTAHSPAMAAPAGTAAANGMAMKHAGMGMMAQAGSLPERLDRHEAMLTAHLDGVRKEKAALSPLYAALTPEQVVKFDAATTCHPKPL
jgi:hypothetical protein